MKRFVNFLVVIAVTAMAPSGFGQTSIKEPNVSGQFYSADTKELSSHIEAFFQKASNSPSGKPVELLIAPHAGYVYSGPVAAYGFKAVSQKKYQTVVILAPSHFYQYDGVSVWPEGGFRTPLGMAEVDADFAKNLTAMDERFEFHAQVFEREHSLEVEIPFIQKTFPDAKIVPVIMGQASYELCEKLAKSLQELIGERTDVLIVVSTDMSHYHDDAFARKMDAETLEVVKRRDAANFYKLCSTRQLEMCGFIPATTALIYARDRGLAAEVLRYANSGDVTRDKSQVVGYSSVIFYKEAPAANAFDGGGKEQKPEPLTLEQKKRLMAIARGAIHAYVKDKEIFKVEEKDPRLSLPEGAFVTIEKDGRLRGCIGNIVTPNPLYRTVRDMAIAAAAEDPRFSPVAADELGSLEVEISVLSQPWAVHNVEEIVPGVHGVLLRRGSQGGIFLPQVATEWKWNREELLSNLCSHKAGLPADCWKDPQTRIEIFTADVFSEHDLK
ncbi:MAG: AmmeMemoRadiSam system protein B [Candidatus Omnitrophota bacterium]|nr:AmmeMemoRadiSam system protein B [Candidatus Omnitrophota bacterium]MDZ4243392.1 AmmeMemoRadiSam system protein B [Candidatus Omnitrophota bacterium]